MDIFYRLAVLILLVGLLLVSVTPVMAHAPFPQAQPTPIPQAQTAATSQGFPWLALLVLVAPLVFMVWRSTRKKDMKITSVGCLPVIDEEKRPFQRLDDD